MPRLHRTLILRCLAALLIVLTFAGCNAVADSGPRRPLPNPAPDAASHTPAGDQVAVLSGGCFWGMQWVYQHVEGVKQVRAGYSGGTAASAHYADVSTGDTGHAESVRIVYDPAKISYGKLLKVFFSVAHNPTERNRQGPDVGSQYRSVIFYANPTQRRIARNYIAQLTRKHVFDAPIVTQVTPLKVFYPAEAYHQDYAQRHPDALYIRINDAPKITHLKHDLPALYVASRPHGL